MSTGRISAYLEAEVEGGWGGGGVGGGWGRWEGWGMGGGVVAEKNVYEAIESSGRK